MLIEVCGPDGSGKSTLVDSLRGRIRDGGCGQAYERTLRSESRNLLEIARLSSSAVFSPREIELVVLLDAVEAGAGELAKYRGSPVMHVFVQNYVHALTARVHARGLIQDPGFQWLLKLLPAPDLSIRLKLEWRTSLARISSRSKGDGILDAEDAATEMGRRVVSFEESTAYVCYPQVVLDASRDQDQVSESAWTYVSAVVGGGEALRPHLRFPTPGTGCASPGESRGMSC